MRKRLFFTLFTLCFILVLVSFISLCFGSETFSFSKIFEFLCGSLNRESYEFLIIKMIRMPRICLAALVGASLALSGMAFQGLLKNPLADPYIVGTSSGAALGASIAIFLKLSSAQLPVLIFAFVGSCLVMVSIYVFSLKRGRVAVETLLLSGVIAGAFCSSIVSLIMTFSGNDMQKIMWWLMGCLSGREDWNYVFFAAVCFFAGFAVLLFFAPAMNVLSMGEDVAFSKGINVERLKVIVIAASCLLTSCAVSVSGTIGFVGFMLPHIMRSLCGGDHRILTVSSALGGAIFLIVADTVSRSVLSPSEIPVGIITAICGVPVFFFVLKKMR